MCVSLSLFHSVRSLAPCSGLKRRGVGERARKRREELVGAFRRDRDGTCKKHGDDRAVVAVRTNAHTIFFVS